MSLFLVGVVLLLGFALAEVNDSNSSLENDTVANEAPLDENQTGDVVEDVIIDDVMVGDLEAVVKKDSPLDNVVSYVSGVIDKINAIHENLVFVILIVLGVLLMFVYSIFFDYSSAEVCFSKASSLHRKAEKAHVSGDYAKAKRLYDKSYSFREKGESRASWGDDDGAI